MNSQSDLLGLSNFEQVVNTQTDTTIYGFNKLVGLLLSCNPNTIEMLGCNPEHYFYVSESCSIITNFSFLKELSIHLADMQPSSSEGLKMQLPETRCHRRKERSISEGRWKGLLKTLRRNTRTSIMDVSHCIQEIARETTLTRKYSATFILKSTRQGISASWSTRSHACSAITRN